MTDGQPVESAISDAMHSVLNSIIAVYESSPIPLPTRQYTAVGEVVHDCEQLTVSFIQMYLGSPGAEAEKPQRCEAPRTMVLQAQLVRCLPKPTVRTNPVPSVEAMNATTAQQTADAWLMMDGVLASAPANWIGALADVSVTPPSGGFQAVQVNLVVGIP